MKKKNMKILICFVFFVFVMFLFVPTVSTVTWYRQSYLFDSGEVCAGEFVWDEAERKFVELDQFITDEERIKLYEEGKIACLINPEYIKSENCTKVVDVYLDESSYTGGDEDTLRYLSYSCTLNTDTGEAKFKPSQYNYEHIKQKQPNTFKYAEFNENTKKWVSKYKEGDDCSFLFDKVARDYYTSKLVNEMSFTDTELVDKYKHLLNYKKIEDYNNQQSASYYGDNLGSYTEINCNYTVDKEQFSNVKWEWLNAQESPERRYETFISLFPPPNVKNIPIESYAEKRRKGEIGIYDISAFGMHSCINKRNKTKYQGKPVFLISDETANGKWADILSIYPAAMYWENRTGEFELHKNPVLIYQKEVGGFNIEPIIYFMQKYKPDKIIHFGEIPEKMEEIIQTGLGSVSIKPDVIQETDYLSYFDNYCSVVYAEKNYSIALQATQLAAYMNIPPIVKGSSLDKEENLKGKEIILVGNINCPIEEKYCKQEFGTLENVERENINKIKEITGKEPDKMIFLNPNDIREEYAEPIEYNPVYGVGKIKHAYYKDSLSAPALAIAKNELMVYTTIEAAPGIADFDEKKIKEKANQVSEQFKNNLNKFSTPDFLTIMASPKAVPLSLEEELPIENPFLKFVRRSLDRKYTDLDNKFGEEIAFSRIFTKTPSGTTSYTARAIFMPESSSDGIITITPELGGEFINIYQTHFDSLVQSANKVGYKANCYLHPAIKDFYKIEECYNYTPDLNEYKNKKIIFFSDHGFPPGWGNALNQWNKHLTAQDLPPLDSSIVISDACSTTNYYGFKSRVPFLFAAEALEKGAIAHIGAVDFGRIQEGILEFSTIGEDIFRFIVYDDKPMGWYLKDIYYRTEPAFADYILMGDPTIKLSKINFHYPYIDRKEPFDIIGEHDKLVMRRRSFLNRENIDIVLGGQNIKISYLIGELKDNLDEIGKREVIFKEYDEEDSLVDSYTKIPQCSRTNKKLLCELTFTPKTAGKVIMEFITYTKNSDGVYHSIYYAINAFGPVRIYALKHGLTEYEYFDFSSDECREEDSRNPVLHVHRYNEVPFKVDVTIRSVRPRDVSVEILPDDEKIDGITMGDCNIDESEMTCTFTITPKEYPEYLKEKWSENRYNFKIKATLEKFSDNLKAHIQVVNPIDIFFIEISPSYNKINKKVTIRVDIQHKKNPKEIDSIEVIHTDSHNEPITKKSCKEVFGTRLKCEYDIIPTRTGTHKFKIIAEDKKGNTVEREFEVEVT